MGDAVTNSKSEPLLQSDPPLPQMSPAELAALLGNTISFDIDSTAQCEMDASEPSVDPKPAATSPPSNSHKEESGPSGATVLEVMESGNSRKALETIRAAGKIAVNTVDDLGRNALLIAATEGHEEVCRELLRREDFRGVNNVNSIGSSVLHLAAGNDHVQICRDILACPRFNLGINAQNERGHTALDFSVQFGGGIAAYVLKAAGGISGGVVSRKRVVIPPPTLTAEENSSCESDLIDGVEQMNELDCIDGDEQMNELD